jgi:hypothetical protein
MLLHVRRGINEEFTEMTSTRKKIIKQATCLERPDGPKE